MYSLYCLCLNLSSVLYLPTWMALYSLLCWCAVKNQLIHWLLGRRAIRYSRTHTLWAYQPHWCNILCHVIL